MASVYDRADIYDLLEDENRYAAYKKHWETVLDGKNVKTLLDVSIGSGSVTLPLVDLGVRLTGCDLSESMLRIAAKKPPPGRWRSCWNVAISGHWTRSFRILLTALPAREIHCPT